MLYISSNYDNLINLANTLFQNATIEDETCFLFNKDDFNAFLDLYKKTYLDINIIDYCKNNPNFITEEFIDKSLISLNQVLIYPAKDENDEFESQITLLSKDKKMLLLFLYPKTFNTHLNELQTRSNDDYAIGKLNQQLKAASEKSHTLNELSANFLFLLQEDFDSYANNEGVLITKNPIMPIANQNIASESHLFDRFDAAILNNDYDAFTRLYLHYKKSFALETGNADLIDITTEIDSLLEKLINAIPNVDIDHATSLQDAIKMMLDEGAHLPLNYAPLLDKDGRIPRNYSPYKEWFFAQREKAVEPFQKKILASIHLHESPQENILAKQPQEILLSVVRHLAPEEVYVQLQNNKEDDLLLPALNIRKNDKDYQDFLKNLLYQKTVSDLLVPPITNQ